MPIETLRREIEELNEQIAIWEADIYEARDEIAEKEAEIERLEAARSRNNLITQLTEALSSMSNEQLATLASSLTNGEIPTISTPTTTNPTVLVVNNDEEEEYEITEEMTNSYMTLVGTSHQKPWIDHRFVPEIGTKIVLSKETATSNCYGLIAEELQDDYADQLDGEFVLGILPSANGSKPEELASLDLPCKTHQSMWNNADLDEVYVVTGNVPGKFITLAKYTDDDAAEQTEVEESSSTPTTGIELNILNGHATNYQEARRVFENEMPDHCTLSEIIDINEHFVVYYNNHRANTMENMRQAVIVERE